ncbi:hypothetical protein [Thiolapillus sp.]|uniref:hypothetical protein n=1 Tax=Thiolapillus sp. TaxID=2017437 RepID=UPI003AF9578F
MVRILAVLAAQQPSGQMARILAVLAVQQPVGQEARRPVALKPLETRGVPGALVVRRLAARSRRVPPRVQVGLAVRLYRT